MALRVVWLTGLDELEAIREPWDELARAGATPFSQFWWTRAWARAFDAERRITTCAVFEDRRLVAIAPMLRAPLSLVSASNAHTPTFEPLARDVRALETLLAAVLGAASLVSFGSLAKASLADQVLHEVAIGRGMFEVVEGSDRSPVTHTEGSFDEYRAVLRRGWSELERRGRKLRREHEVELRALAVPALLEHELEDGLSLEAAGWKGAHGTAILSHPSTAGFYREIAREAHDRGMLRFSSLHVDGTVAAFDFAFNAGGRYFLLKTGFDERLRRFAPGLVLRLAVVEACFSSPTIVAHEFLGPEMPWKQLFATGERPHIVRHIYRRDLVGVAGFAYRAGVRPRVKRLYLRTNGFRSATVWRRTADRCPAATFRRLTSL